MIVVEIDNEGEIRKIAERLGSLVDKAPRVYANAMNATARRLNTLLKQAIRQTYTYHRGDKLRKGFRISRKATSTNPSAVITITSESPHLTDFKVTPSVPSKNGRSAVKAKILKRGSGKAIPSESGIKSFIARFQNGKLAAVQRDPPKEYTAGAAARLSRYGKHTDMTKIKAFFGPSVTKMAGKVYEDGVAEETGEILQENIQKQIDKVIARHMTGK